MKKYTDKQLLDALKNKCKELGRTARKEDIDNDSNMPSSSTYFDRFGGLHKAYEILNITPNVVYELTLEKAIQFAKDFYNKNGKSPSVTDFDNTKGYPHSSFVREMDGMKWNEFLSLAGLPLFDNGDNVKKNREAEVFVKDKLISNGYIVEDLSEKSINAAFSFIVNNNISISVKSSIPILNGKRYRWHFKAGIECNKFLPDYYICVGLNKSREVETVFVIPTNEITVKTSLCIYIDNHKQGKYSKYISKDIKIY